MDNPVQGESNGEKWYATLRVTTASPTATARRGALHHCIDPASKGAR